MNQHVYYVIIGIWFFVSVIATYNLAEAGKILHIFFRVKNAMKQNMLQQLYKTNDVDTTD